MPVATHRKVSTLAAFALLVSLGGGLMAQERAEDASAPLVTRSQVRLNLAGAEAVVRGAKAQAVAMKLSVNIAVVDDGGHLLAFARMDGARPASSYTAITKATASATLRAPTRPLPPNATNPDPLLNLSVQNAAAVSGGKFTTLYGGVPIVVEGQVVGAVGVGGATGEQDAEIAAAGVKTLAEALADSSAR
jgi:glc operon protein GlcG